MTLLPRSELHGCCWCLPALMCPHRGILPYLLLYGIWEQRLA